MKHKPVLMIDDDERLVSVLRLHLRELGLELEGAFDGESGLEQALSGTYSLVIIDGNLPKLDGFEVCRILREKNATVPILMLTSRVEEVDTVVALELGADDYVTKPYQLAELSARIKALVRRGLLSDSQPMHSDECIVRGELTIDHKRRRVTRADQLIELTSLEYDLLLFLASSPGQVFSKRQLLEAIWQTNFDGYEHSVNLAISRLRRKVETNIEQPRFVITVRGVGYRFADEAELVTPG